MPHSLEGRVAVVTGASRGIGQAIAVRMAAEGAKVALIGRDEATRRKDLSGTLEEGLARIEGVGGVALAVRADIGDPSDGKARIVEEVVSAFGRSPDIMVQSAAAPREWGVDSRTDFADMPAEWFFPRRAGQRLGRLGPREGRDPRNASERRRLDPVSSRRSKRRRARAP